ncbi:serine/threonine-protein kinase HipA [Streptosporangium becharense]|uniref:Serine/threonine-protein kinase HipA n=1 Tax=Streptosporangium becharense TaxID=1816182 RepID=A0A7W9IG24_9ACTN|nr:type II toxin-antitoxin system HipA family toxin [Streptosporangium becharense]MBB2908913.1 serine/threonine-protein kinase HipA [Streptosporangium becharense]MBB5820069.1 serine/threonine-protein kinase HipA [Streptosporangium becharense]
MTEGITTAQVLLGDRLVGMLEWRAGRAQFRYLDRAADRPVLGLQYEYNPRKIEKAVGGRLPSWFGNLLPEPESGLRRLVTAQLGLKAVSDFTLLTHLGQDLPGAVRVIGEETHAESGPEGDGPHPATRKMSFSLAGMQVKLSMARTPEGFRYVGVGGDWIVKFPSSRHDLLPENEHSMMTWSAMAGIEVPEHTLTRVGALENIPSELEAHGRQAFAIRRFDRLGGLRIHQEDFAQVFGVLPHEKDRGRAEDVGRVIQQECPDDLEEYVRRITACVVMGNTDEHLKNWSLQYPGGRRRRLSPAYDLVCVTSYPAFQKDVLTLPLNGQPDTRYITLDHFRGFAETVGADPAAVTATVRHTVHALADSWPEVKRHCPVPAFVAAHLDERLQNLPLVKEV